MTGQHVSTLNHQLIIFPIQPLHILYKWRTAHLNHQLSNRLIILGTYCAHDNHSSFNRHIPNTVKVMIMHSESHKPCVAVSKTHENHGREREETWTYPAGKHQLCYAAPSTSLSSFNTCHNLHCRHTRPGAKHKQEAEQWQASACKVTQYNSACFLCQEVKMFGFISSHEQYRNGILRLHYSIAWPICSSCNMIHTSTYWTMHSHFMDIAHTH